MEKQNLKNQPPLLLTSHGPDYEKQSFYSLLENRYHTTCIPILCNKRVLASTHGWLVLIHRYTSDCCLWNPVSMEIMELPRLDKSHLYNKCILSKPPTEPDCHILFNSSCTMEQSFCKIGDLEFVHHSLEEEDYELLAIASFQGKIYGVIDPGYKFVTIEFVGKTLEFMPILTNKGEPWRVVERLPKLVEWHENYLIESPCGGEFLLVIKMFSKYYVKDGVEFRIVRVNINGMECIELDNIGDQTIFIGYNGSGSEVCCSSLAKGIKRNSIYYTDEKGRDMYVYDLRFGTKDWLVPCPAAGHYQSASFWVELQDDILNQLTDK